MDKSHHKEKLLNFLQRVDHDFSPPLSSKVILQEYVEKITQQATFITRYSGEQEIIGLTVFYCNDVNELKAYVSLVAVARDQRSRGYARDMMREAIGHVRDSGYHSIGIHSNNPHAISLYEKLGFNIISGSERVYMELNLD